MHQPTRFSCTNDPSIAEEWLEVIESVMSLFLTFDVEYIGYLLKGGDKV